MTLTHSGVIEHLTASIAQQQPLPPPTVDTFPIPGIDPVTLAFFSGAIAGVWLTSWGDRK